MDDTWKKEFLRFKYPKLYHLFTEEEIIDHLATESWTSKEAETFRAGWDASLLHMANMVQTVFNKAA